MMNNEEKILEILSQMQATLDQHTEMFQKMDARMDRTETDLAQVKDLARGNRILIEQDIDKKLSLLAEGHELLVEKLDALAPKSRVETLEEQVDLLKQVVRMLSHDVAELKKGA